MEAMDICPVCKTESVIYDEENGQKVRVCTECGAMDDDMQDFTIDNQYEGTTITDGQTRGPDALKHRSYLDRICKGLTLGRKLIRALGPTLHFNKDMTENAVQLYERVFDGDVKGFRRDKRHAMCVACMYAVAKLNNHGLHIRNMGKYLDIPKPYKRFGYALNILRNKYQVNLPQNNISSDAYHLLSEKSFTLPEIQQVQKLIPLLHRSWIATGRTSKPTIVVAAFFVWKAHNLTRRKVSYSKFSKMFGFTSYKERKREIENMLEAMARELPWVRVKSGENIDVTPHLNDVIQYQNVLFDSALKTTIQNMKLEQEENDSDAEDLAEILKKEENETVFKKEYVSSGSKKDEDFTNDVLEEIEPRSKRMKYEHEDQKENCLDEDEDAIDLGSDDDTNQYIRTMQEVKEIEALYAQAENIIPESPANMKSSHYKSNIYKRV